VVEYNLLAFVVDNLIDLVKVMFPDSYLLLAMFVNFTVLLCGNMVKVFPYNDKMINNLVGRWNNVCHLIERFAPPVDQEAITQELEDYQLTKDTEIGMEKDGIEKSVDRYWGRNHGDKEGNGTYSVPQPCISNGRCSQLAIQLAIS